jgi:hypothetical protein
MENHLSEGSMNTADHRSTDPEPIAELCRRTGLGQWGDSELS